MISLKCFFKGHDLQPLVKSKSIVNSVGMQIGLASYLMCTRCAKGESVVTWSLDPVPVSAVKRLAEQM